MLGIAYAFLPYGFYRNVGHANLVFPLVPLLALASLRACGSGAPQPDAAERWLTRAACVGQGLSFVCYSFFAAWLVLSGALLGWLSTRQRARLRSAAVALALLVAGAAVPVVPTALYRMEHGRNERLQYQARGGSRRARARAAPGAAADRRPPAAGLARRREPDAGGVSRRRRDRDGAARHARRAWASSC